MRGLDLSHKEFYNILFILFYSSKWQKAVEFIGNKCEGRVPDLVEGMKYTFRVIAVNKGGNSKPSEPSDPIIAKDRQGNKIIMMIIIIINNDVTLLLFTFKYVIFFQKPIYKILIPVLYINYVYV